MNIIEIAYSWAYNPGNRKTTTHLIIHHAAASSADAKKVHGWHLGKGWAGIAYHYYIRKDGSIYRGRPEKWSGGHTTNWNHCSIGICFEGDFDKETMSTAQVKAGAELVADIKMRYPGIIVGKHSAYNSTACPGKNFPFYEITSAKAPEPDKNGCPYGTSTALVKDGSVGTHVKRCQWYLSELGYNVGLIDGICGRKTVNEITNFQIVKGLEADGICGAQTWAALESAFVIIEEGGDMDGKTIYEKLNEYLAERKVPDWAIKELEEAKQMGITDGTDPMQFIPRYQAAIMAKRAIEAAR